MKTHSLKEGMAILDITQMQAEIIFTMAKQIGIERGGTGAVLQNLWYTGKSISYCVNSTKGCLDPVTFEQFITAMVTPECEPMKADLIITSLREENEALKKRLAELEPKEDMRVDFGENVTFSTLTPTACVGNIYAKDGDRYKVLVSGSNYEWQLLPDYYEGRNAVQLIKKTK